MFKGKAAIITGSTQGLGLAIARGLAKQSCNVMLSGLGGPSEIETLRAALEAEFNVAVAYNGADLSQPQEIRALVSDTVKRFGSVEILVNNAVYRHRAPVEVFPEMEWDRALAVNVSAPFHLVKHALPHMRRAGWGRIVNVGSIRSYLATAQRVDYVTAKHAIIGMTRAIAQELLKDDITCNAICPGSLRTPHSDRGIRKIMGLKGVSEREAEAEYLKSREPRGRFNSVDSVVAAVLFLCGPASSDINGTAIPIDGGRHGGEQGE